MRSTQSDVEHRRGARCRTHRCVGPAAGLRARRRRDLCGPGPGLSDGRAPRSRRRRARAGLPQRLHVVRRHLRRQPRLGVWRRAGLCVPEPARPDRRVRTAPQPARRDVHARQLLGPLLSRPHVLPRAQRLGASLVGQPRRPRVARQQPARRAAQLRQRALRQSRQQQRQQLPRQRLSRQPTTTAERQPHGDRGNRNRVDGSVHGDGHGGYSAEPYAGPADNPHRPNFDKAAPATSSNAATLAKRRPRPSPGSFHIGGVNPTSRGARGSPRCAPSRARRRSAPAAPARRCGLRRTRPPSRRRAARTTSRA